MFTVLRPESTLSAPPEQSESVRYQINQSTSIELKERACWQAGSSWFNLFCSMMVTKCSKSFAGFYKSWVALKVMHDYVVRKMDIEKTADLKCISRLLVEK